MRSIYFVHYNFQLGGIERTNIQWAKIFLKRSFRVYFLTTYSNYVFKDKYLNKFEFFYNNFDTKKKLNEFIFDKIKNNDVIIICQAYLVKSLFPLFILKPFKKYKIFLTERNSSFQYKKKINKFLLKLYLNFKFNGLDKIIFNSNSVSSEKFFQNISNNKKIVIINPRFDDLTFTSKYLPSKINKINKTIVIISRHSSQKKSDLLYKICDYLIHLGYNVNVFNNTNLTSYSFPYLNNPHDYLLKNDVILLFLSEYEGYPNILIEARSAGIPIVFNYAPGGILEILKNYKNSFSFDPEKFESLKMAVYKAQKSKKIKPEIKFIQNHLLINSLLNEMDI